MKQPVYGPPAKNDNIPLRQAAVLETLLGLSQAKQKMYCIPSQKKILELTARFHKIEMSRSTLNRCLGWLERHKYIKRLRRHRKVKEWTGVAKDGHMLLCSTLYQFCANAFNYIRSLGKGALKLFSHFRMPQWEKQRMLSGKSAFLGSLAKCLANQNLPVGVVKSALRI